MNQTKLALISVSNKTGIVAFATDLIEQKFSIIASDGTASYLQSNNIPVKRVYDFTKSPEILGGRVKTLHPAIFAGILSRDTNSDIKDLLENKYEQINVIICNLYPFSSAIEKNNATVDDAVENIDIDSYKKDKIDFSVITKNRIIYAIVHGGVALLRAAAKNHERVTVVCHHDDYKTVIEEIRASQLSDVSLETRRNLALKAFVYTAQYDSVISDYFRKQFQPNIRQLNLKYGINPHQKPAQIYNPNGELPISVLNGSPSYINLCDALNGWQLVSELKNALNLPAATSFKHVSPAGAAVSSSSLTENQIQFYVGKDSKEELSALATAYVKARAGDPMSSFGDFIALSDTCDVSTARIIAREVSDGIIAPKYEKESLEILRKKKGGLYCILQIDPTYVPPPLETRTIFGLTLEQKRNETTIDETLLKNIVSENKRLPEEARKDLLLATITVKYTQSNSVCYAKNGQVIGIGAGQQSRIHCTRLAGDKANNWWLRQHPNLLKLKFKRNVKRAEIANAIDYYVTSNPDTATEIELQEFNKMFEEPPFLLTLEERQKWIKQLDSVCLSSDAFFPFRDNIDRARQSGVKYIIGASGSVNDNSIIQACNGYNMVLIHTNLRLFHH